MRVVAFPISYFRWRGSLRLSLVMAFLPPDGRACSHEHFFLSYDLAVWKKDLALWPPEREGTPPSPLRLTQAARPCPSLATEGARCLDESRELNALRAGCTAFDRLFLHQQHRPVRVLPAEGRPAGDRRRRRQPGARAARDAHHDGGGGQRRRVPRPDLLRPRRQDPHRDRRAARARLSRSPELRRRADQ